MESIEIELYVSEEGKCPFQEWIEQLDKVEAVRVEERLSRVRDGNFGDAKRISEGIWELRLFHGSGYRIYYHVPGPGKIVILDAGDKKTQRRDLRTAQMFLEDYLVRTREAN